MAQPALRLRAALASAPMRRLSTALPMSLLMLLVLAPAALAPKTTAAASTAPPNDKVVTNVGFIVIVFFPMFVFVMSMIQRRLEKRKEARKAAKKQLGDAELARRLVARRTPTGER